MVFHIGPAVPYSGGPGCSSAESTNGVERIFSVRENEQEDSPTSPASNPRAWMK